MKKTLNKAILKNCLCASLLFGALLTTTSAKADGLYIVPEATPMIKFDIAPEGTQIENNDGVFPARNISSNEKFALFDAAKRWQDMLHIYPKSNNIPVVSVYGSDAFNAFAGSDMLVLKGEGGSPGLKMSNLALTLLNIAKEKGEHGEIEIGQGLIASHSGWAVYKEPYPIFNEMLPDLYSTMVHEIYHALGLMSSCDQYVKGSKNFYFSANSSAPLSVMDSYLRMTDGTNIVSAAPGMKIKTSDSTSGEFDLVNGSPYFTGLDTMMTLSGKTIKDLETELGITQHDSNFEQEAINHIETIIKNAGGLKNYANQYSPDASVSRIVYGLPMNGLEPQDENTIRPELSHIELRNSFMSHQDYQNWGILMEAELAFLRDIGFESVEPREFFGKSYYLNNITDTWKGHSGNGIGYGYWDIKKQQYTSAPSKIVNGIGLHLYGDNLDITQQASISSNGLATIGVRIDGVKNTYTLDENFRIDTVGKNSIGLATMWGKNHTINLEKGSIINASGKNGMALVFDFGKNIMGGYSSDKGSYSYFDGTNNIVIQDELNGALVSNLNIAGEITGSKAAIFISQNAHVENINILNGSQINGNILSNWNSIKTGYAMGAQVTKAKYTNINFGVDSAGNADTNYKGTYTGIINGANKYLNTLKLNVKGGKLTYNDGTASVNCVDISENAALSGSASYKVTNNFTIGENASYTQTGTSLINAAQIINNGSIDIKGKFTLDSLITSALDRNINLLGTMHVLNDNYLTSNGSNNLVLNNGATLNLINNDTNDISLNSMTLNGDIDLYIDADWTENGVDRFVFENKNQLDTGNNNFNIVGVNVMNTDKPATEKRYDLLFVDKSLNNQKLLGKVNFTNNQTITTPIYNYTLGYNETANRGNITLNRMNTGTYKDFNPAVLSSSVAAQVGGYLNQLNTFNEAFSGIDTIMSLPSSKRKAMELENKYASSDVNIQTFSPNQTPEESKGVWFKPFTTFEKVDLDNGPKVNNVAYGSLVGTDSQRYELKNGWNAIYTGYAGYLGSHQKFNGISIYQNGGVLGATGLFYKNNFFTGLTANVGASVADVSNMYGREDITMLSSGIASKTGYNWEISDGKFIVQPNLLLSYSFINTFDYTNSANLKVKSDPLHAIQIAPGLKFIGNLKNSWQPYASVQMLWNIMDDTKFSVIDVNLPELSVDPYVQYGIGVQKNIGERFTGFGQVMLRNGGRTGIALSAGGRWILGND